MIVTKTRIGSWPAGTRTEMGRTGEAYLVQRGLAEYAEPDHATRLRTKAEMAREARKLGIDVPPTATKSEIANLLEGTDDPGR